MLHQAIPQVHPDRVITPPVGQRSDRAMDVFQYGTALLALAVVALLAVLH